MTHLYEHSTIIEEAPVAWRDALGPGFTEHTRLVEDRVDSIQRSMESLRPGASSDAFQRLAGQIEALRWVLRLSKNSQKPKPGDEG